MTVIGVLAHSKKELGGSGLDELRRALADKGVDAPVWREVVKPQDVPVAVAELVDAGVETLFVWGGDGTVQQCIDALRSASPALAILPAGTANLFAGNLGVPTDLEEAVSIGLGGRRRTLDLGTVNDERFGVMAGVGFDAEMIRTAEAGLKERLGRLGYVVAGALGLQRDAVATRVTIDGGAWFDGPSTCVLVGNMGGVFGGVSPFPDASPDDGRLDVGVVTADSVGDWARMLGRTVIGQPEASPFIQTTSAETIEVALGAALPYELDGDARAETRELRFRVQPAAIDVYVPASEGGA